MRYLFWDGDIPGLRSGRINLRDWYATRLSVKAHPCTGILLIWSWIGVLLLLGVVSSSETEAAPRRRMRRQYCMKKYWKLNGGYGGYQQPGRDAVNSLLAARKVAGNWQV